MLERIKKIDTDLFLLINSKHNQYWDNIMFLASDKFFWFPFYAFILLLIIRLYRRKSIPIIFLIVLLITWCDQTASSIIKPIVQRVRPSHNPTLQNIIHIGKMGGGGHYGFVSSHAANTFGLTVFLLLLLPGKYNYLKIALLFWAVLVSYSRIYNGVHYPLDIIGGGLVGTFYGIICYTLYNKYITLKSNKIANN